MNCEICNSKTTKTKRCVECDALFCEKCGDFKQERCEFCAQFGQRDEIMDEDAED